MAPGALAGAAVGATSGGAITGATAQYANAAAKAAAEQEKSQHCLCAASPAANDYQTALEDISELSEQFIQDIGTDDRAVHQADGCDHRQRDFC